MTTMQSGPAWLDDMAAHLRPVLSRYLADGQSEAMTLMQLACLEGDATLLATTLRNARRRADPATACRLQVLATAIKENRSGFALVRQLLQSGIDHGQAASPEEGIVAVRSMFDRLAERSPEAGVALYSLGDARTLDAATAEVIAAMRARISIAGRDLLDIGCGYGRLAAVLAGEARAVTGIDVSAKMIEIGRRRYAKLRNLNLLTCSGRDLLQFGDAAFDLAFAVDSLPYLMQAGTALVQRHFAEIARVLRTGGDLLIFNFSYRNDIEADRRDLAGLAHAFGFAVIRNGTRDFTLWDAALFHLTRR